DLGFAGGGVLQPQKLRARLEELGGAVGLGRLMAEGGAVVAEAGGQFCPRLHRMFADRNGEIGAQAQFASRQVGQGEGAAADFLARAVEKYFGRLQDRGFLAPIAPRGEEVEDGHGLGVERLDIGRRIIRKGDHQFARLRSLRISAARSARLTAIWAARPPVQAARLSTDLASSAPRARSLIVTSPRARSSPPSMIATAAPRLSAYLS